MLHGLFLRILGKIPEQLLFQSGSSFHRSRDYGGCNPPPVGKALKNLRQGEGGVELIYKGHEGAPKKGFFTRFMVTLGSKIYKNTMINNG